MSPTALQAVLLDMDGTLVDTEPYWMAAEQRLAAEHGGTWTEAQARSVIGTSLPSAARQLQLAGVDLPVQEVVGLILADVVADFRRHVPFRPGAPELLQALARAEVPLALVTSSDRVMAQVLIDALPPGTFAAVVTGDTVTAHKPDPEPYRQALQLLAEAGHPCDPGRTVALEDSPSGVRSALAAGVRTVGVLNLLPLADTGAHRVVAGLEELGPDLLAELVRVDAVR